MEVVTARNYSSRMEKLSTEITDMIVEYVSWEDLKNVRLVSTNVAGSVTRRLFSKVHVILGEQSHPSLEAILGNEILSKHIRTIKYFTTKNPYISGLQSDVENKKAETGLTKKDEAAIAKITLFPNLQAISMTFCRVSKDEIRNPRTRPRGSRAPTTPRSRNGSRQRTATYRYDVLTHIFRAMIQSSRLMSLTLEHLKEFNDERLLFSADFVEVIGRLSDLRLNVIPKCNNWPVNPADSALNSLFAMPHVWLKSTQHTLTSLTLHATIYWGYKPFCDLRCLHFPKLKRLDLGRLAITHDWQMDWVLSHSETLEHLTLDTCAIATYIRILGSHFNGNINQGGLHSWEHPRQWSTYFERIGLRCKILRSFQFGKRHHNSGRSFDDEAWETWGIFDERYMTYHSHLSFSNSWVTFPEFIDTLNRCSDRQIIKMYDYSDIALVEDQTSYERLMGSISHKSYCLS